MPSSIEDLPYEILSGILTAATDLNLQDAAKFTYGLSEAPQPVHKARLERHVRGQVPPDVLRWNTTDAIRQVNRRWHEWALDYSLRTLYITRWRGSERWMESRNLATIQSKPSGIAVYRDSFCSLKKTVDLFERSPHIASHVRRVWFNGYNVAETNAYAFELLKHCSGLQSATIPWTALRHGSVQDWVQLLHVGPTSGGLNSLELLAVDLKHSQITNSNNARDETPLESSLVDFSRLRRLKIFGDTKFQPIVDRDLRLIARTAVNLEEIHITGLSSVTIEGVMTLVRASRHHLRVLEYSPLSNDGFERPEPSPVRAGEHMCDDLLDCPRLRDLSISLPSICPALFSSESVEWSGEVQIRTAGPCGHEGVNIISEESWRTSFWDVLEKARRLMARRDREDANLDIQIFISRWIFEPKFALVHGNYDLAEIASDLSWPLVKEASGKGPYGHTGLYGKDEGSYSSVSEVEFLEGLRQRYIGL